LTGIFNNSKPGNRYCYYYSTVHGHLEKEKGFLCGRLQE